MKVRQRVLQIRRRVAAATVTVFIALFAGLYVQMASGNDPTLGSSATTSATSTTSSSSSSSSSDDSSSSDEPSAVTTRQS
jgi:hypothetical protein